MIKISGFFDRIDSEPGFIRLRVLIFIIVSVFAPGMVVDPVFEIQASYPYVRNFSKSVYDGGTQNWGISQNCDGEMFFGNRNGLLHFDSRTWNLYRLPNHSTVRGVFCDSVTHRVYVGGSDEFGYFFRDRESLRIRFQSLLPFLVSQKSSLHEVWNIFRLGGDIWFQADNSLIRFDGKRCHRIMADRKILASSAVGRSIYVALDNGMLMKVDGNRLCRVAGTSGLLGKRICSMLSSKRSGLIIVTASNGLYSLRGTSLEKIDLDIDRFLESNQVFCSATDGSSIVLGTVSGGIVIHSLTDGSDTFIGRREGLQNNTVLNIFFDRENNIWLSLDNGIDYVVNNSAVRSLLGVSLTYGAGYASYLKAGCLYLGTNQGLYCVAYRPGMQIRASEEDVPLISGQVWSIDEAGGDLFVCSDAGLFYESAGTFRRIDGIVSPAFIRILPGNGETALVSTQSGFHLIEKKGVVWTDMGAVGGYDGVGGRFEVDRKGYIWMTHWMKGVYRFRLDILNCRFADIHLFGNGKLTGNVSNIGISKIDGRIILSTYGGYYQVDEKNSDIVRAENIDRIFRHKVPARLYQAPDGRIWNVSPVCVCVASRGKTGYEVDSITYRSLKDNIIPGYDHLSFVGDDLIIAATEDGFNEIDALRRPLSGSSRRRLVIKSAYVSDSLVYSSAAGSGNINVGYDCSSLKFEYVVSEYRGDRGVVYSTMLEGLDKGWTQWHPDGVREFTHLHEGTYTLRVRSLNNFTGETDAAEITFTVSPPIYRTWWALCIYALLLIVGGHFGYRYIDRISRRRALDIERRKEREMDAVRETSRREALEKDYEIASLKSRQLEIDVRHKSEELSNTTHNLVRKNQILLDISGRLSRLRDNQPVGSEISREVGKISEMIRSNISHDDDWNRFTRNFDGVYHDFLHTLQQRHPKLTQGDLRMCAYVRMGLATKDIAPLLNISPKSVEMSRYRLRRKLELGKDVSLASYLSNL